LSHRTNEEINIERIKELAQNLKSKREEVK
jgi:hypothetical protein